MYKVEIIKRDKKMVVVVEGGARGSAPLPNIMPKKSPSLPEPPEPPPPLLVPTLPLNPG